MVMDTGAACSIVSDKAYNMKFPDVPLQPTTTTLHTYSRESIASSVGGDGSRGLLWEAGGDIEVVGCQGWRYGGIS